MLPPLEQTLLNECLPLLTPDQVSNGLAAFAGGNSNDRVRFLESLFDGAEGMQVRDRIARFIVRTYIPVNVLVPQIYEAWRPPIEAAMIFVAAHLSSHRLAKKLVEQFELPVGTPPEQRLLRLIAQMPGLQKLGQVIARNRHLRLALRKQLSRLENGINDVPIEELQIMVRRQLAPKLTRYDVKIADRKLSEASVSAVVRFTWLNPRTKQRERGVFKILKPHIPDCFAEDMKILQDLSKFFGEQHHRYNVAAETIPDTFAKVRELLEHEVNFSAEQKTLRKIQDTYRGYRGVAVPRLIGPFCTATITAMTEEAGTKVTANITRMPLRHRRRVAVDLIDALVLLPLFSPAENAIFHCDPHAGNLLYDKRGGRLVLIDWALTDSLSCEQRRHLILLFGGIVMRNRPAICHEIAALAEHYPKPRNMQIIEGRVNEFLDSLSPRQTPQLTQAMKLLERIAVAGISFPSPLIMFSKVMFTLDGILNDVAGPAARLGPLAIRRAVRGFLAGRLRVRQLLKPYDWLTLPVGAALTVARVGIAWEEQLSERIFGPAVV